MSTTTMTTGDNAKRRLDSIEARITGGMEKLAAYRRQHRTIRRHSLEERIRIGGLLAEARGIVVHGEWELLLRRRGIDRSKARRWIQLWEKSEEEALKQSEANAEKRAALTAEPDASEGNSAEDPESTGNLRSMQHLAPPDAPTPPREEEPRAAPPPLPAADPAPAPTADPPATEPERLAAGWPSPKARTAVMKAAESAMRRRHDYVACIRECERAEAAKLAAAKRENQARGRLHRLLTEHGVHDHHEELMALRTRIAQETAA